MRENGGSLAVARMRGCAHGSPICCTRHSSTASADENCWTISDLWMSRGPKVVLEIVSELTNLPLIASSPNGSKETRWQVWSTSSRCDHARANKLLSTGAVGFTTLLLERNATQEISKSNRLSTNVCPFRVRNWAAGPLPRGRPDSLD
jgi:hypothetical protein